METAPFHCSAEWHFARLNGRGKFFAATMYSFAYHVSKNTGNFYSSIPRLAHYFGVDERTVRKALHALEKTGFFEIVAKPRGLPVQYRVVGHKEWATLHDGRCTQKADRMPWDDEPQDALGKLLYAVSASRFKPYPNFIKGMRNTGHSDAAIANHFRTFLRTYQPKHKRLWSMGLCQQFMTYLRGQPVVDPQQPVQVVPGYGDRLPVTPPN